MKNLSPSLSIARVINTCVCACVCVLAAYFAWLPFKPGESEASAAGDAETQRPPSPKAPIAAAESTKPSAATPDEGVSGIRRQESPAWYAGFASSDPYRLIVGLREARERGSFAASMRLAMPCNHVNFSSREPLAGQTQDAHYQRRVQAKERLASYCNQIPPKVQFYLDAPLADDLEASRYKAARRTLDTFMVKPKSEVRAALQELARHGALSEAASIFSLSAKFQGQSWNELREIFGAAFEIAQLRATASPGMAVADIRLQVRCWRTGLCEDSYDAMPEHFTDDMKQKTSTLAASMERALREGDVSAFIGSP